MGIDGPYRFSGALSENDIISWRREFPILARKIHLANCSQSAQSIRVRKAVESYLDNWLQAGMDWDFWMAETGRAKGEFARIIGAEKDEISVAMSVSDVISGVGSSLDYGGRRNRIVTTEGEFPTVGQVWLAHQRAGARISFVPMEDGEIKLDEYEKRIDDETLLVSLTHVHYKNGFKQDLDAIVDICHTRGAMVLVDGYQGCGVVPVDVHKQKIDMYTSGNLKYLLGIPGIAFLYVRGDLAPRLLPSQTGWFGQRDPFSFKVKVLDYAETARRFDTGTPPVIAAFAARAGMEIINEAGPAAISERLDFLKSLAAAEADKRGIPLASPRDPGHRGPVTAIPLKMNSHLMEEELAKRDIIASSRGDVIRLAPHFYTTGEEIIHTMDVIKEIMENHKEFP
jgi:selenocysteine lyase/cysteine desulfurase